MEYPFGQFRSGVRVVCPPDFLPLLSLLGVGVVGVAGRGWKKAQRCATAKTLVCYQYNFNHKCNTQHVMGFYEVNELHPSQIQHTWSRHIV